MLRIILCDDNARFLNVLKDYVEKECEKSLPQNEDFEVGPIFANGADLLEYVKDHHVDVVLLDIDMPSPGGFEVAKVLCDSYKEIKIVFVSAYDNLVYNSFEFYPFAYVRKSHITEEIPKILRRIIEKRNNSERRILLNTNVGAKTVDVNSILYVESDRNYYKVSLVHGKTYVCRGTLTELENALCGSDFFRIHSAYLVNLEHVERVLENGMALVGEARIPIAQKRMQAFSMLKADKKHTFHWGRMLFFIFANICSGNTTTPAI